MTDASRVQPIASARHTIILSSILLGIAAAGWVMLQATGPGRAAPPSGSGLFLGLIAAEVGLLYYTWIGVRRRGSMRELISDASLTRTRSLVDLVLGIGLLGLLLGAAYLLAQLLGPGDARLVKPLVAGARTQPVLWIALSTVAGISEELVYRGYLQRQFLAWSGSRPVAIVAQALLFGVSHGYQGGLLIARITVLGLLFGIVADLRRSRVPGIVAHAGLDIAGGLLILA